MAATKLIMIDGYQVRTRKDGRSLAEMNKAVENLMSNEPIRGLRKNKGCVIVFFAAKRGGKGPIEAFQRCTDSVNLKAQAETRFAKMVEDKVICRYGSKYRDKSKRGKLRSC